MDAPDCIAACRLQFFGAMAPAGSSLHDVCDALSPPHRLANSPAWRSLYCCDSQLCGVENRLVSGTDPNANWLKSACQNIGYHEVADPGPPDDTHSCPRVFTHSASTTAEFALPKFSASSHKLASRPDDSSATRAPLPTQTRVLSQPSSLVAGSLRAEAAQEADGPHGPSVGAAVGIALAVTAAVAVVVAVIYGVFRFRRRSHFSQGCGLFGNSRGRPTMIDSPSTLVSPTNLGASPHVTSPIPPALLGERKILLPKKSRRPRYVDEDCERQDHALSSLHSSVVSAAEMVSSCQKPLPYRPGEAPCPRTQAMPKSECPAKSGSAVRPTVADAPATTVTADVPRKTPPDARECKTAVSPKSPRQYHLPFQAVTPPRPGPPPDRALPPTPCGTRQGPPVAQTGRRDRAGSVPGDESQAVPTPRNPNDTLEHRAGHNPNPPQDPAGTGSDPDTVAPTAAPVEDLKKPAFGGLGDGELEKLGGSYK